MKAFRKYINEENREEKKTTMSKSKMSHKDMVKLIKKIALEQHRSKGYNV